MKLIILNQDKNVTHYDDCKLQFINKNDEKCLKFLNKEKEETCTSPFDRIYIRKNNFLCCLNDQESNHAIVCVFPNEEYCEHIFNAIIKVKAKLLQSTAVANEDEMFKDNFFIPLIKQVQADINGHQDLKAIILDFVNLFDSDERLGYMTIMANTLLVPSKVLPEIVEKVEPEFDTTSETLETSFNSSINYNMRKRSFNNISYKESDDEENGKPQKAPRRKSDLSTCFEEPAPRNCPNDVIFDIVGCLHNGKLGKKLLVFTSAERKKCYEFIFIRGSTFYKCVECYTHKKICILNYSANDGGSKTFNFITTEHICEPIDYLPSNYQASLIINPNFKLLQRKWQRVMKPLLIIFDSVDNNICYKFGYDTFHKFFKCIQCKVLGTTLTARFIHHDGKNAIELSCLAHTCKPQKYIPDE